VCRLGMRRVTTTTAAPASSGSSTTPRAPAPASSAANGPGVGNGTVVNSMRPTAPPRRKTGEGSKSCGPPRKTRLRRPRVDVLCAKKNVDILEMAAERLGWDTTRGGGGLAVWVLVKEDMVTRLRKMREGEWLSHVPGMQEACGKVSLSRVLTKAGVQFWPRAWRIPQDELEEIIEQGFSDRTSTLILKPDAGAHGQGIMMVRVPEELRRSVKKMQCTTAIVQEYIDRPLLLDGHKWDARIYALVVSLGRGDFRCFLAREGLVRVCVDAYEKPTDRNLHRLTAHLTNYSLSKFSDKFVFSEDPADATKGCKRTLSAVFRRIEDENLAEVTVQSMWRALEDVTRETVKAMTFEFLSEDCVGNMSLWDGDAEVAALAADKLNRCFQIVGLDVLFDDNGRPWLMEVNNNPSLSIDCVRPLAEQSRAEVNALFAQHKKESRERASVNNDSNPDKENDAAACMQSQGEAKQQVLGAKWGRPCRCNVHPRPHAHHICPVDVSIKLPVVEGALSIVQRADAFVGLRVEDSCSAAWAEGTIFRQV